MEVLRIMVAVLATKYMKVKVKNSLFTATGWFSEIVA